MLEDEILQFLYNNFHIDFYVSNPFQIAVSFIMFFFVIFQRVSNPLYKNSSNALKNRFYLICGQVGLFLQGMACLLVFSDSIISFYEVSPPQIHVKHVFFLMFMFGTLLTKVNFLGVLDNVDQAERIDKIEKQTLDITLKK